jgi:hypothetical protein
MEKQQPPADALFAPTLQYPEQWQEVYKDDDLTARFDALVGLTQGSVDVAEYPWAADESDVRHRWQHLVEYIGDAARSIGHPLFSQGLGWVDEARVADVLGTIDFRSFDASFVENALILTHSLMMSDQSAPSNGLTVFMNTLNNIKDCKNPELVAAFTKSYDLRDMAEPTETLIGDMTVEEFGAMDETVRDGLNEALFELVYRDHEFGNGYGWFFTPQKDRFYAEREKLITYEKLIEFGTSDEEEIREILDQRKADEVERLRQEWPDFGKLPESFEDLSDELKRCVAAMFEYFDDMRERYEIISIDTHTMSHMDFTDALLNQLKAAGVLTDEKPIITPGGWLWLYKLAEPYYECWVARHYPASEEN